MKRALLSALALAAATGCIKNKPVPLPPISTSVDDPDVGRGFEELKKGLESTVIENYTQWTYNNLEAFLDSVAAKREIHLVGATARNVVIGIRPPELKKDRRLFRERSPRILSKNLDVHLSENGSVAWVFDEISYRVQYMNREASIPIRATAVYVRDVDRWAMVSEHHSYGVSASDLRKMAGEGKLAKTRQIHNDYGSDKKGSASLLSLVGRFINGGTGLVLSSETLVVFPGPTQEYHGMAALAAPTLAASFGSESTVAIREFRVQIASDRHVAWIVANLSVNVSVDGTRVAIPLRGTFVLEKPQDREWGIMQAHISAGLLEGQISSWVFSPN